MLSLSLDAPVTIATTRRRVVIVALLLLATHALAYVAGRFAGPRHEEERRTSSTTSTTVAGAAASSQAQLASRRDVAHRYVAHVETETHRLPSGETVTRRTADVRDVDLSRAALEAAASSSSTSTTSAATSTSTSSERIVERDRPGWRLDVAAAYRPSPATLAHLGAPDYVHVEIQRRLLGTLWAGPLAARVERRTYVGVAAGLEW